MKYISPQDELREIRKQLDNKDIRVLDYVWSYYLSHDDWPKSSKVEVAIGSPNIVNGITAGLSEAVVLRTSIRRGTGYVLTPLGLLLTSYGDRLLNLLSKFYSYIKSRIREHEGVDFLVSERELSSILDIDDAEICWLRKAADVFGYTWGAFQGGNPEWNYKLFDRAVELLNAEENDMIGYLTRQALECIDREKDRRAYYAPGSIPEPTVRRINDSSAIENLQIGPQSDRAVDEVEPKKDEGQVKARTRKRPTSNDVIALVLFILAMLSAIRDDIAIAIGMHDITTVTYRIVATTILIVLGLIGYIVVTNHFSVYMFAKRTLIWFIPILLTVTAFQLNITNLFTNSTIVSQEFRNTPYPSMTFIDIPGGEYVMGSHDDGINDCDPYYRNGVELDIRSFQILQTEVTQEMWHNVIGETFQEFIDSKVIPIGNIGAIGDSIPMYHVSWFDCQRFIEKLNTIDTLDTLFLYRLPSEAEWEYASQYDHVYSGDLSEWTRILREIAWCTPGSGITEGPMIIARKTPNSYGLFDMYGNVWEWCEDCYHDDYQGMPSNGTPWTTGECIGDLRVRRGGCFSSNHICNCTSTYRSYLSASVHYSTLGFRVVRISRSVDSLSN